VFLGSIFSVCEIPGEHRRRRPNVKKIIPEPPANISSAGAAVLRLMQGNEFGGLSEVFGRDFESQAFITGLDTAKSHGGRNESRFSYRQCIARSVTAAILTTKTWPLPATYIRAYSL